MLLRNVTVGDVDAYVRMRCDPVMMAELGGPQPREGIDAKVARDVASADADVDWILMIVPDGDRPDVVAGTVTVWTHDGAAEIGWMVLPEFQGKGLAKRAVRAVLERARDDGRWGPVHAYPAITNGPSNGICRSLGFALVGPHDVQFGAHLLHSNHWMIDPAELS